MGSNDDVLERLDRIAAILQLAYADKIGTARARIREDRVNATILDGSKNWTPAGRLNKAVKAKTKQSGATVNRRIGDLLARGVLEKRGGGPTTAYRATGLI